VSSAGHGRGALTLLGMPPQQFSARRRRRGMEAVLPASHESEDARVTAPDFDAWVAARGPALLRLGAVPVQSARSPDQERRGWTGGGGRSAGAAGRGRDGRPTAEAVRTQAARPRGGGEGART